MEEKKKSSGKTSTASAKKTGAKQAASAKTAPVKKASDKKPAEKPAVAAATKVSKFTNKEVVAKAVLKNVGIPTSKMKLSADVLRGKSVSYALGFLTQNNRAANPWLKNLVNSAIANAIQANARVKVDELYVASIIVNQGRALKRMMPRAMGRGTMIQKRYCHVLIELGLMA